MDSFLKELGNKIKRLREDQGLSREELGKAAGTTHVTIGRIEKGENPTNVLLLRDVARELRVPLEQLLSESEPAPRTAPEIQAKQEMLANLQTVIDLLGPILASGNESEITGLLAHLRAIGGKSRNAGKLSKKAT